MDEERNFHLAFSFVALLMGHWGWGYEILYVDRL